MSANDSDSAIYVTDSAKDIKNKFHQPGEEDSSSSQPIDQNELFLSPEGVKWHCNYEIGSKSASYEASSRRHPASSYSQDQNDQRSIGERIQAKVDDRLAEMQARVDANEIELAEMREFMSRCEMQVQARARAHARIQEQMRRIIATLPPEYHPPPDEDEDEDDN